MKIALSYIAISILFRCIMQTFENLLTSVFVLGFVHLPISTFSSDANDFKLVNTALSPVDLGFLDLAKAWTTNSAMQPEKEIFAFAKERMWEEIVRRHTLVSCVGWASSSHPAGCVGSREWCPGAPEEEAGLRGAHALSFLVCSFFSLWLLKSLSGYWH